MARWEHGRLWVPTPLSLGSTIFGLARPTFTIHGDKVEFSSEDEAFAVLEEEGWEVVSHSQTRDENWIYTTYVLKREIIEETKVILPSPPPKIQLSPVARQAAPSGFLRSLGTKVVSFRFFPVGRTDYRKKDYGIPSVRQRSYNNRFVRKTTINIYWELALTHPKSKQSIEFAVQQEIIHAGKVVAEYAVDCELEAGTSSSWCIAGPDFDELGHIDLGDSTTNLYFDGEKIASGTYTVY